MRPLAAVGLEQRIVGWLYLVGGVVFAMVAVGSRGPEVLVFLALFAAAMFGAMHFPMRRGMRKALERVIEPPITEREPRYDAIKRVVAGALLRMMVLGVVYLVFDFADVLSVALLGIGAATLVTARTVRSWERANGRMLLDEPRAPRDRRRFYAEP